MMVLAFPAGIEVLLGGLGGSSAAVVFAFLGPVLALLGLGPRRATAWFAAFAVVVIGVILVGGAQSRDLHRRMDRGAKLWTSWWTDPFRSGRGEAYDARRPFPLIARADLRNHSSPVTTLEGAIA